MNKLVLKDGTEIIDASASRADDRLLISIPGNNLAEAALTFSDPEKTEEIQSYFGVKKHTFYGFTDMRVLQYMEPSNSMEIWMKGTDVSDESEYTVPEAYLPKDMRTQNQEE